MPKVIDLNSGEFDGLLERLAQDVTDAAIFRKLWKDLIESQQKYAHELIQSWTFWSLSIRANSEAALLRLCRIYAANDHALTLSSWLKAIKNNQRLFSEPLDLQEIGRHLELVSPDDSIVGKLIGLRNNFIAHISWRNVTEDLDMHKRFPLSSDEVDTLVGRATDILNRYSLLFKRTVWSTEIVGRNDFMDILKRVRRDLERQEAEIAEEYRRTTQTGS
jgi:hypothetical protein